MIDIGYPLRFHRRSACDKLPSRVLSRVLSKALEKPRNQPFGKPLKWFNGAVRLSFVMIVAVGLVLLTGESGLLAQTTNTSTKADQAGDVVAEVVSDQPPLDSQTVSLEFLNEGKNPKSLAQLRAMQDHVREISDRVKESTVNINMGMGQGTGVLVSSDGIILTAAHVIERPRLEALITFSDGSQARARTLGVEAGKDSGMLKIFEVIEPSEEVEPTDFKDDDGESDQSDDDKQTEGSDEEGLNGKKSDGENSDGENSDGEGSNEEKSEEGSDIDPEDPDALPLANDDDVDRQEEDLFAAAFENNDLPFFPYLDLGVSEELKDGQWVIAVGHPGGLDEKRGMVVRVGRIINQRNTALRTDCTLVGGDSGGPLVDMDGNLVAIHSRIGSRLQDNLHVPVDVFSDTWDMLISGYKIGESGKLGLSISPRSTLVSGLMKNGPAARGGVQVGDIISSISGTPVSNRDGIREALTDRYPYEKIPLTVRRGSNEVELVVMLGEARPTRARRRRR